MMVGQGLVAMVAMVVGAAGPVKVLVVAAA